MRLPNKSVFILLTTIAALGSKTPPSQSTRWRSFGMSGRVAPGDPSRMFDDDRGGEE